MNKIRDSGRLYEKMECPGKNETNGALLYTRFRRYLVRILVIPTEFFRDFLNLSREMTGQYRECNTTASFQIPSKFIIHLPSYHSTL
jgi:hypothetical protein